MTLFVPCSNKGQLLQNHQPDEFFKRMIAVIALLKHVIQVQPYIKEIFGRCLKIIAVQIAIGQGGGMPCG